MTMETNSTHKHLSPQKHFGQPTKQKKTNVSVNKYVFKRQKTKAHRKHIKIDLIVKLHFDLHT